MNASPARPTSTAWFGLGVLAFINLFNYLDRYVVAGITPLLKREFDISQRDAGLLGSLFIIVYMLVSPAAGVLGDRFPRKYLVAGGVMLWSLATVGSGLATTFALLLLARAIIGIGEAAYGTVAPGLISDLFHRDFRTRALAFFYVAIPVGAALGYMIGGYVGEAHGWRAAFFVAGAPGILLALLFLFTREPVRGAMDGPGETERKIPFKEGLRALRGNRIFWFNTAGLTLMTFSIGGLAYHMPTFLVEERGFDPTGVGFRFGAITASAGVVGTLLGGWLGERAERRRVGGGMWVSGIGLLLGAPLMFATANLSSSTAIYAAAFLAQVLLFFNSGPINAAIVNCVPAAFRGFAVGLNTLLIHALGDAISPPLIGWVGDAASLERAIEVNALPVILGGLVLLVGTRFVTGPPPGPEHTAPAR